MVEKLPRVLRTVRFGRGKYRYVVSEMLSASGQKVYAGFRSDSRTRVPKFIGTYRDLLQKYPSIADQLAFAFAPSDWKKRVR